MADLSYPRGTLSFYVLMPVSELGAPVAMTELQVIDHYRPRL